MIVRDKNVREFLLNIESLLYQNEAINSLMLGICLDLKLQKDEAARANFFRVINESGSSVLAAIQTPPYNLILSPGERPHVVALAAYLNEHKFSLPGVVGPDSATENFVRVWRILSNQECRLGMDQYIYSLTNVILPSVSGYLETAKQEHLSIVSNWLNAFGQESLPEGEKPLAQDCEDAAKKAISRKNAYLWMIGGSPVSVAHLGRSTQNGVSIRAVYTPPAHRNRGFGSAVVAHLSKLALEDGKKFCTLYSDASNSSANNIYQSIGYQIVSNSKHFIFSYQ